MKAYQPDVLRPFSNVVPDPRRRTPIPHSPYNTSQAQAQADNSANAEKHRGCPFWRPIHQHGRKEKIPYYCAYALMVGHLRDKAKPCDLRQLIEEFNSLPKKQKLKFTRTLYCDPKSIEEQEGAAM